MSDLRPRYVLRGWGREDTLAAEVARVTEELRLAGVRVVDGQVVE